MSLLKTFLGIAVLVGLCAGIFIFMRDRGIATPLQHSIQMSNPSTGTLSGTGLGTAPPTVPPATPPSASDAVIALANDPRRTAPTVALVDPAKLDPETAKRYQTALDDVELDGCNSNGTLAVRVRGERLPHIVRSGQILQLPGGLAVTLRQRGYPACRVTLYDGKTAIGEVAGF
jgi:hypothetical protein